METTMEYTNASASIKMPKQGDIKIQCETQNNSQTSKRIKSIKKQLLFDNLDKVIQDKFLQSVYKRQSIIKTLITHASSYIYVYDTLYKVSIEELDCYKVENYLQHIPILYVNNYVETLEVSHHIPSESALQLCKRTTYTLHKRSNVELVCDRMNDVENWYFLVYNNNENNVFIKEEIASFLAFAFE
jgi:hypothetical protein